MLKICKIIEKKGLYYSKIISWSYNALLDPTGIKKRLNIENKA